MTSMEHDSDPSSIRMVIHLVGTAGTVKTEPIADKGGNKLASGDVPKESIVNPHESERNCHARFDGHLDLISRFLGNGFAVLKHALYNHVDDLVNVL